MRGRASRVVDIGLGLNPNLINPFLGIGVAHAGARCDYLRYVSAVARWHVRAFAKIGLPKSQDLSLRTTLSSCVACANGRTVVGCFCRPKQLINVDLRRIGGLCGLARDATRTSECAIG